jgi:hypothetical protein
MNTSSFSDQTQAYKTVLLITRSENSRTWCYSAKYTLQSLHTNRWHVTLATLQSVPHCKRQQLDKCCRGSVTEQPSGLLLLLLPLPARQMSEKTPAPMPVMHLRNLFYAVASALIIHI